MRRPFHISAYSASLGNVTDSDIQAGSDDVIQVRNNHLILSENYNMMAVHANGVSLTRLRFGNVALTYRGQQHIWPLAGTVTIPSRPEPTNYGTDGIKLPVNEEITLLATHPVVGPDRVNAVLWLATPDWRPVEPSGEDIGWIRATAVVPVGAVGAWGGLAAIVMERDLYNGVYAVTGGQMIAPNAIAWRMQFRTSITVNGRVLRPGGLVTNATNDVPFYLSSDGMGEWGRFATYELPSVQTFGDAAGGTYEIRLRMKYLGTDPSILQAA